MKKLFSILMFLALLLTFVPQVSSVRAQGGTETATLQPNGASMSDTQIVSGSSAAVNYGTQTTFAVGEINNDTKTYRSLLEFDLSGLPNDATVVSATLSIWVNSDYSDNARTMHAYPILEQWTESQATWNVRQTGVNWQTAGASGASDVGSSIGSVSLANNLTAGTKVDLELDPAAVQSMLHQNYFGFKLQMETETNDLYSFRSSDHATSTERPQLVIEYTPDTPIPDPGWLCVNGFLGVSNCVDTTTLLSPFYLERDNHQVMHIIGGSSIGMTAAKLQCTPYPRCVNDYPIYYRIEYWANWTASVGSGPGETIHYYLNIDVPGGTDVNYNVQCDAQGSSGDCRGVLDGSIPISSLPINYGTTYTLGAEEGFTTTNQWPSYGYSEWTIYFSLEPFDQDCAEIYIVPAPETFVIDPTLETPLGVSGSPADNQIYTTVIGQTYSVRVEDGPWNDGTTDRIDAQVSGDGTTWITWDVFTMYAVCVDVNPAHPEDDFRVIYFTATTDEFHIRVNDTAGAFANNTNDAETPYSYVIGLAFAAPLPPTCEAQFSYDPVYDNVASITLPSTDDDVPANNELTEPLEAGEWYGVEVASGNWHETGAVDERIDLEFQFTAGGTLGGSEWADLAEGSGLVQCTSSDGTIVFIQAPTSSRLTLHLRVNDQDIPQDFADNVGTLGINIVHATFTRFESGCELQFDLGTLVYSDTVAANATSGKVFATSFASTTLDISYSYGLTPGAWYVLDTTGGPWWQTFNGGGYNANQHYYDVQVRSGTSGEWGSFDTWEYSDCVIDLDALGHQRVYFQVPNSGGIQYFIKVGGANPFGRGEMGWNLYQGVDISPPGGTIDDCGDFIYDPEVASGIGDVDSSLENGEHILGLEVNTYRAIQIESANTAADPPYYADSGWKESAEGTETDSMQVTMDGETWSVLPDHPGVLCYYYTPVDNELVFIIQVTNGSDWKLRADSSTFSNNVGNEIYRTYPVTAGDTLDPWTSCADDYTATVPAINEHEWIPPQDEEGINLMPTLTYTPENDPNNNGIIMWGDPGLQAGHDYMVETMEGPWEDGESPESRYIAQLSSDGGDNWYLFEDHPNVICSVEDQIGWYWKAIFHVDEGQIWKIRVADIESDVFTDNTGNLAYSLNLVNEFPIDGPGSFVTDYDPAAFDVCSQSLIRPEAITLSEIGNVGNYLADWMHYVNRSMMSYFAWCPRHTDALLSIINSLKNREPLATIAELDTVQKNIMADIASYDWEGGGYNDTSIFGIVAEGGGAGSSSSQIDNMFNQYFMPGSGDGFDVWDGGDLVNFPGDQSLPDFYYTCSTVFTDYLPSRLKTGVCFASAYWKDTGASFWIQLIFDIGTIFLFFGIVKGAVQSLVYMMTGVRPWTKDGATRLIVDVANGQDIIQPVDRWGSRRRS